MRFPRYPEYKESGISWVGNIPSHWGIGRLKTLFSLMKRVPREKDEVVTAFRDGTVTLRTNRRIDGFTNSLQEIGYQGVREGDLVIHAMDAFAGAIGVSDSDGKSTPVYSVCTPRNDNVLARYYGPLLRHMALTGFISSLSKGIRERSTEFRWAEAGNVELPIPSITEQATIAAFLDHETAKIDTLVTEQEKLIDLLKEKRQAVISHAVTKGLDPNVPMKDSGVEWLGQVPKHWEVAKLRRFVRAVQTGGTPSAFPPNTDIEDGTCWFTPGDFSGPIRLGTASKKVPPEGIEQGEAKVFPAGAVLVVGIGATLGKIGYLLVPASANQQINAILPNVEVDGLFLAYSLSSKTAEMRNLSNASTIGIMNQEKTKELWVAVPPLGEQERITKYLDEDGVTSDALVNESQHAIDLLKERRAALISAAVTGKIDVRTYHPELAEAV